MKNDNTVSSNQSLETLLAAVDLGSNSFRLEIGRYHNGQIHRVDYLKEAVRQGGDLDAERNLKPEAIERGLKCLARFGEAIKNLPKQNVRAVATQTLREAKTAMYF
jgi:exopolyphosphatase / guanosine-5'-triphosphate,3'-diphosphate pyrophosphatase